MEGLFDDANNAQFLQDSDSKLCGLLDPLSDEEFEEDEGDLEPTQPDTPYPERSFTENVRENHDQKDSARPEQKRKGRRKIPISYIQSRIKRGTTYAKRKIGLFKKVCM